MSALVKVRWQAFPVLVALTVGASVTRAAEPETLPHDVPLFTVSKSENKNLVQYSLRVDGHCAPVPGAPVFAFWQMLENGPGRTEPLLAREQRAYGVASQVVMDRREDGGRVRLVLNAVPKRAILIDTTRAADGSCRAYPRVSIDGTLAYIYNVYIHLRWLFGVDYLLLSGWSVDGSHVVSEKLQD
jgi:hypothetical protein